MPHAVFITGGQKKCLLWSMFSQDTTKQLDAYLTCTAEGMDMLTSYPAVSDLSLKATALLPVRDFLVQLDWSSALEGEQLIHTTSTTIFCWSAISAPSSLTSLTRQRMFSPVMPQTCDGQYSRSQSHQTVCIDSRSALLLDLGELCEHCEFCEQCILHCLKVLSGCELIRYLFCFVVLSLKAVSLLGSYKSRGL